MEPPKYSAAEGQLTSFSGTGVSRSQHRMTFCVRFCLFCTNDRATISIFLSYKSNQNLNQLNYNEMKKLLATIGMMFLSGLSIYAQDDFVKGADVGFLTMQERHGQKFYDTKGNERECLDLLQDYQISAVRLRVWVNPTMGSNGKEEVLQMAKRAKAKGMDVMLSFHYSDSWSDPAKQPIPKDWMGHDYEQMKRDITDHTVEVLTLLKENGIQPRWAQVGNETSRGMLWNVKTDENGMAIKDENGKTVVGYSMGYIETHPEQYAGFIRAGYDAVKSVFPETTVIVHLDDGFDAKLYDYNLGTILKYGGKFDMIGMSLYPYWALDGKKQKTADETITNCMANIRRVAKKFNCDVMIVETGYEVDESRPELMEQGRDQLARVIREAHYQTDGHCKGVFYWEPQCLPGGYKLGAFDSTGTPTVIMDGFIEKQ